MTIDKKENYTLVSPKNTTTAFIDFISEFESNHTTIANENVFVTVSDNLEAKEEEFFVFLRYAELHNKNGTTFVLVHKGIDIDKFPEELNIAPTLIEAEDILEMEDIQRDLGF